MPETRFQAASISKPVAASAALRLVAEVNAEIALQTGDDGVVTGFTLQQNGQQITASKEANRT